MFYQADSEMDSLVSELGFNSMINMAASMAIQPITILEVKTSFNTMSERTLPKTASKLKIMAVWVDKVSF